jgi:hypothetical protein
MSDVIYIDNEVTIIEEAEPTVNTIVGEEIASVITEEGTPTAVTIFEEGSVNVIESVETNIIIEDSVPDVIVSPEEGPVTVIESIETGPPGPPGEDGVGVGIITTPDDGEVHLTPKASSTGVEGTIFYCSTDNQVYVATE